MKSQAVILASLVVVAGVSCGDDEPDSASAGDGHEQEEIVVFAASSLTSAFEELGMVFEADNPGGDVKFNFLASSDLATQIEQGAPADVFASADEPNMDRISDADLAAGEPEVFVHNKLEVIVPPDNPGDVQGLQDLADDELVVSLCNEECPAGRYSLEIFDNAGIDVEADSLESEVKAVVTRVSLGEADAGIAYVTDAKAAAGEVQGVPIGDDVNVLASYSIVALQDSSEAAQAFVDLVLSDEGESVMQEYGFLPR